MRIAIVSEWFSEKMGYAENFLPSAFGIFGHDVILITSDLQVYGNNIDLYENVYKIHLGDRVLETGKFFKEFYTLYRNPHIVTSKGIKILGLEKLLVDFKPDLVYSFEINTPDFFTICETKKQVKYKYFCESRMHKSVFNPPTKIFNKIKEIVKKRYYKKYYDLVDVFYPIAPDVEEIIIKHFGIPKSKIKLGSLAVNTNCFYKNTSILETEKFKIRMGYNVDDIVCLYTGRFTLQKGPLLLAEAIEYLYFKGYKNIKGLFVGNGDDEYLKKIACKKNCKVHSFVEVVELFNFYNSMDIGVWPLQESNSQLDAMACGMPIIINDTVKDKFRIEGNGFSFKVNNIEDLANKILLLQNKELRRDMGSVGADKIIENYSWRKIAEIRLEDYLNL